MKRTDLYKLPSKTRDNRNITANSKVLLLGRTLV